METEVKNKRSFFSGLNKIGPGIIAGASTIGPGTVTTAAVVGSTLGYSFIWVVVLALIMRALFQKVMYTSALVTKKPFIDAVREYYGAPFAILTGVSIFLGTISYQVGNFTGTGLGATILIPQIDYKIWGAIATVLAIWLIFGKNVYSKLETLMKVMVVLMILTFAGSLIMAGGPSLGGVMKGLVPNIPSGESRNLLLPMLATSLTLSVPVYGTYMAREAGWSMAEMEDGTVNWDVIITTLSIALVTFFIMFTMAVVLFPRGIIVSSIDEVIEAIVPVIGRGARPLIGFGFFFAALSSMIINAQTGATMILSALGKPNDLESNHLRFTSAGIMILGSIIALVFGKAPVQLIMIANASSIITMPLIGLFAILLITRKDMGKFKASKGLTAGLVITYGVVLMLTLNNVYGLLGKLGLF